MGRRKSSRELQRDLQYAQAREQYQPPQREEGAATKRRPKIACTYPVLSPLAPASTKFTIQASQAGINFFSDLLALGLEAPSTAPMAPKGFEPAKLHAMVSDASPSLIRAKASNRPYTRYAAGNRGSGVQTHFTAPVSADTPSALDTRVKALFESVKTKLGSAYGRAWFEAEKYPLSASGVNSI